MQQTCLAHFPHQHKKRNTPQNHQKARISALHEHNYVPQNRYVNADGHSFWLIEAQLDADQSKRYERAGNGPRCLDEIQGRDRQAKRLYRLSSCLILPGGPEGGCHKLRELSWVVRYNRYWHCICNSVFSLRTKAQNHIASVCKDKSQRALHGSLWNYAPWKFHINITLNSHCINTRFFLLFFLIGSCSNFVSVVINSF